MITSLSILIPVYNDVAAPLVEALWKQAEAVEGLEYEIVVADDGSFDPLIVKMNMETCRNLGCRYVKWKHHICRAAMRNDLARLGRYDWRLMVDTRVRPVRDDFIRRYLESGAREGEVVIGGVEVDGGAASRRLYRRNLRFRYEKHEQPKHSAAKRAERPYASFRATNFFHHRSVLERVPYDEDIMTYGYEDVMLGKALREAGIRVAHIDNPVAYMSFECNRDYIYKVNESMYTLALLAPKLRGYSPLLAAYDRLRRFGVVTLLSYWHELFGPAERWLLCRMPSLTLLKMYKLGLFVSLVEKVRK